MKLPLLSVIVFAAFANAADPTTDWQYAQRLDAPQSGLQKLSLPVETIDAARPGLEDLRVIDPAGREVPYLLERPVRAQWITRPAKKFDVALAADTTIITLETGFTQAIEGLTLDTAARDFIKSVQLEGSADGKNWKLVARGLPVFRQPYGAAQLRLNFPAATWSFLRLTIDDRRAEPVAFTGATVHAARAEPPSEPLPVTITERTENDQQSRLTLNLSGANLMVASLQFECADPLFTRRVSVAIREVTENAITERVLTGSTIYRVAVEGQTPAAELSVPVDLPVPQREALVLVDNQDNPPLNITAIRAKRRPVYVTFFASQPGSYQVLTGNARCAAPRYDLAGLAASLKTATAAQPTLGALTGNTGYQPREVLPEVQDLGTPLDVGEWKYRKPVQFTRAGVQQLELDLETLAVADASFRDLRLMRDGKQRPFILERTSIQRKITPAVTPANDPKRPTVSRWEIKLPQSSLPVTRLTCTTTTALFRRDMRLYEQPKDERGDTYNRHLGQASWTRTPPVRAHTLEIALNTSPLSDTLILETENGDNPAIALDSFQCYYPAARVWFKAPVEPATFLYYGNRSVGFPQYDIALVAPQLLSADKSPATLGPQETLKPTGWAESLEHSRTGHWLFWGVLGVVVLILIVVITRLLPKQS